MRNVLRRLLYGEATAERNEATAGRNEALRQPGRAAMLGTVPIETLFLDAGGVLVHPNWARVSAIFAGHGITVSAEALAHEDPRVKRALDRPRRVAASGDASRAAGYLDTVLRRAGVTESADERAACRAVDAYHARHNLWEVVPSDVPPALAQLRRSVSRLVVVSNANGTIAAALERLGIAAYFDRIVDSAVEGVEKPDPEIFRRALRHVGAQPATTLHVGDLYEVDVVGARRGGVDAMLLDPADLYAEAECERVSSLAGLAARLAR